MSRLIVACVVRKPRSRSAAASPGAASARRLSGKIELVIVPTETACRLLADQKDQDVYAVLHVTC